jgi:predicted DCC family thiol-disulfide oxidoreductase YuxK
MTTPHLTVWYNTRCPVCDAGIRRQRNKLIAVVKSGLIAFRDINLEPEALAGHGVTLEDIRRRLHATDASGRLLVGADVIIAVWRLTPGERWLAVLAGPPPHALRLQPLRRPALRLEPPPRALVGRQGPPALAPLPGCRACRAAPALALRANWL